MPFCSGVFTEAGTCSPALGPGMSCLCSSCATQQRCLSPHVPVPVPCGHHIYSPCLARLQSHSFCLALPATHQFTPVCTSPAPCPSVPTLFAESLPHSISPASLGKNSQVLLAWECPWAQDRLGGALREALRPQGHLG